MLLQSIQLQELHHLVHLEAGKLVSVALIGGTTSASAALAFNAQTGTTYTFVLADADNKLVTASNAAAQTYSIPTNATTAFPIGTQLNIIQIGAGQVTVSAATPATTTIVSTGATAASPKCRAQYSAITLIKRDTDSWYAVGDIA